MKSFIKRYFKYMVWCMSVVLFLASALLGAIAGKQASKAEEFNIDSYNLDFTTFIYYTNSDTNEWHELDRLYDDENRIWVDIEKIPDHLKKAVIAIEDERFYKHIGIDFKRTAGAVINYFTKRGSTYGGSTITQQLVKNLTGDDEISPKRKVQEMFRAFHLERKISKDEILEIYLNTIYLSRQCNGVQSAAEFYFGKDVSELTLAESACIAGITQYPALFDPISHPDKNKEKQETVLYKMHELGYISEEEYDKALNEELAFIPSGDSTASSGNSYFVDAVIEEVVADLQTELGLPKQLALKMLYTGGLEIYSTVDAEIQDILDGVYKDESSFPKYRGEVQPQSAMVILDPNTGEIKGMVGGRGEKEGSRTLNRVTHSLRQPGSTIKPLSVYAPALEYGLITPYSTIFDTPLTIGTWSPRNADYTFRGAVTINRAVASSINTVAVKVLDKLSVNLSYDYLKNNFEINSLVENRTENGIVYTDKDYAPLALGGFTDGVSLMDIAGAYSSFANHGVLIKPHTYTKVLDHNGNVLLSKENKMKVAISAETAHTMTGLLQGVVTGGTGSGAALRNMPAAGKTGTTSDDNDRWFIGYTPYYLGAVWFGYDAPAALSSVGYNPSVSVWKAVMSKVHANLKYKPFSNAVPSDISYVCGASGKTATSLCIRAVNGSHAYAVSSHTGEYSTSSTCKIHKEYKICSKTGLLAGDNCPSSAIITVGALGISDSGKEGYIPSKKCTHQNIKNQLKTSILTPEEAEALKEQEEQEKTLEDMLNDLMPPSGSPTGAETSSPQNTSQGSAPKTGEITAQTDTGNN